MRFHILVIAMLLMVAPFKAGADVFRIVALGDSLTAGYGLAATEAFPVRLEAALKAKGHNVEVHNAGVSGDTTRGGLARLDWAVADGTDAVIVELGANDALRGIDPAETRKALDELVSRLTARGIKVMVAGMVAPPNMGPAYGDEFNKIFAEIAAKHGTALYPFFLDGVAGDADLNLPDGMHPTAAGINVIVAKILPQVERLIGQTDK